MEYGLRKHLNFSDIDSMLYVKFNWMYRELSEDLTKQAKEYEERIQNANNYY